MKRVNELLKSYNVNLSLFPKELFDRKGFYYAPTRTIYVNDSLNSIERDTVILHELGHIHQNIDQYERRHEQFELQANRHMIRNLVLEELDNCEDRSHFNYINFMKKYQLNTVADEVMILEEFYKLTEQIS